MFLTRVSKTLSLQTHSKTQDNQLYFHNLSRCRKLHALTFVAESLRKSNNGLKSRTVNILTPETKERPKEKRISEGREEHEKYTEEGRCRLPQAKCEV